MDESLLLGLLLLGIAFGVLRTCLAKEVLDYRAFLVFGALPLFVSQIAMSALGERGFFLELLFYSTLLIVFVIGLLLLPPSNFDRRARYDRSDHVFLLVAGCVGLGAFVVLVQMAGGLAAYGYREEGQGLAWEGPAAILAFFTGLAHFAGVAGVRKLIREGTGRRLLQNVLWVGLCLSPLALTSFLQFRRTGIFCLAVLCVYWFAERYGRGRTRFWLLCMFIGAPLVTGVLTHFLPYLRTQYFETVSFERGISFDDYVRKFDYGEADYGALVLAETLGGDCGELGYGRRLASEFVRVFLPRLWGFKSDLLAILEFEDLRKCMDVAVPVTSFFTGLGELALDFGVFSPIALLLLVSVAALLSRVLSKGLREPYFVFLCSYSPLFVIYGPVYVYSKIIPVVALAVGARWFLRLRWRQ